MPHSDAKYPLQVVSNPFILMTSIERNAACPSSTTHYQPGLLQHAPTHPPDKVNQLLTPVLACSAAMSTEAVPCRPGTILPSRSVAHQDSSSIRDKASSPDARSWQAGRLLQQRSRLMSTFHRPALQPDPASAVPSTGDTASFLALSMQQPPSSAGAQTTSCQLAEHERSLKKDMQAQKSLAKTCSAPMAQLIGLRSTSDRFAQALPAMVEMVRSPGHSSLETAGLHLSGSQITSALRTSSLPPIDDSTSFPQKLVDVEVYSLGMFAFKGLTAHRRIAQLMPTSLSERLSLFPHVLKRGKATCVTYDNRLLAVTTAVLPDVSGLTLAQ